MADYVPSIVIDSVIEALAAFAQPFAPASQIVRAQVNRVPMPGVACIVLTEILSVDLEVPYSTQNGAAKTVTLESPTRVDVQMDFYGPDSSTQCKAIQAAFRTGYAFTQFPSNIKPMYTSDGLQSPLITGEQQWESRWTLTVSIQYNPIITVPLQFADQLTVTLIESVNNL